MAVISIPDWVTFEEKIKELRAEYGTRSMPLLFRGQSDSEWPLTTTLERSGSRDMAFGDYYRLICSAVGPEVKTFVGVDVPEYNDNTYDSFKDRSLLAERKFPTIPLYGYMAYLRHFGFPSPLLDWSRSPFVAAFFAFRETSMSAMKRSIYVYCEMPKGYKGGAVGERVIHPIGPYVQTHQRHFRQRCDYTICAGYDTSLGQWRFDSHQATFDCRRPYQDYLWKFDLPSDERPKVLQLLDDYSLNAYSLFGSEESLLETMWFREFVLRWPKQLT